MRKRVWVALVLALVAVTAVGVVAWRSAHPPSGCPWQMVLDSDEYRVFGPVREVRSEVF